MRLKPWLSARRYNVTFTTPALNTHTLSTLPLVPWLIHSLTHPLRSISFLQLKSMLGQLDEALELTTCALSHARNREEIQELMQLMIYTRSQVGDPPSVGIIYTPDIQPISTRGHR